MHMGEVTVTGNLPHEVIERLIRQEYGHVRECYDELLRTKSEAKGRVTLELSIDAKGTVTSAADHGSDIGDATMVSCVGKVIGKVAFPAPEGGAVKATVPFTFEVAK